MGPARQAPAPRHARCGRTRTSGARIRDPCTSARQVWADADDWYEKAEAEGELEKLEEAERQKALAAESAKYAPTARDPMEAAEAAAVAAE